MGNLEYACGMLILKDNGCGDVWVQKGRVQAVPPGEVPMEAIEKLVSNMTDHTTAVLVPAASKTNWMSWHMKPLTED